MLIQFSVSNFLSFNEKETFSMTAGKSRKNIDRIFNNKKVKLTKCEVIFGANASGKSNLVYAFRFVQQMLVNGLPRNFSNKYFRMNSNKKNTPSEFEIVFLCDSKTFVYSFSIILSTGSILKEDLYERSSQTSIKKLFSRDTVSETFNVGNYFKKETSFSKLRNYGEDSVNDQETLFLSLINKNKGKMFSDVPELQILRDVFKWFKDKLTISFPTSILTGYPYFTNANLNEISELLNALGTGISALKIVQVPEEVAKSKIPDELFNKVVTRLEKANAHAETPAINPPKIVVRSYKEFYTLEMDSDNKLIITTIEFSHENNTTFFHLDEESDGTARLLDLIDILFKISDNKIFVIDEIDRCLHPSMTVKIIELFLKMATQRNTQLIITSHESRLLASEMLRNDEICFVTKAKDGSSIINPLEKYQLRADKKVYAALFDGFLSDAVPAFNDKKLAKFLN